MEKGIGFIGLGVMGAPMSRNLEKNGYSLTVFDADEAKTEGLASTGIRVACSVSEVSSASEVVILSLPSSQVVREVVGSCSLPSAMQEGGIIIDTSTTEPSVSIEIAGVLKERGIGFLDAPVSGGEKAATDGTLSFMVGGDERVFERCRKILEAMGTTVIRVGVSGMGEVAKAVNQMIVGATFAAVAEGFALAAKSGLDPRVLYEAIRNGWAASRALEVSAPAMLERNFRPGGTVNIHSKDLGYALALAKDKDVPTPVTALVHEIFKAAKADGKGQLAQPAIITLWERLLGIEIKDSV